MLWFTSNCIPQATHLSGIELYVHTTAGHKRVQKHTKRFRKVTPAPRVRNIMIVSVKTYRRRCN